MANDKKLQELGAIWVRRSKNNVKYLTGKLEINEQVYNFVGFSNKHKQKDDSRPDYHIYLDDSRPPTAKTQSQKPTAKAAVKQVEETQNDENIDI